MTLRTAELDVRSWRPQGFGRAHVRNIKDPLIEPLWDGERVLLSVGFAGTETGARPSGALLATDGDGQQLEGPAIDAIAAHLHDAVRAEAVVLDGYLTRQPNAPIETSPGLGLKMPTVQQMAGQMLFGRRAARAAKLEPIDRAIVDPSIPIAFVAVDLLAVDDQALIDIPLLERKRILETAFEETRLLRRSPFVRLPVDSWLIAWRAIGFRELAYKAANSRYTPGAKNDDWAKIAIPRD